MLYKHLGRGSSQVTKFYFGTISPHLNQVWGWASVAVSERKRMQLLSQTLLQAIRVFPTTTRWEGQTVRKLIEYLGVQWHRWHPCNSCRGRWDCPHSWHRLQCPPHQQWWVGANFYFLLLLLTFTFHFLLSLLTVFGKVCSSMRGLGAHAWGWGRCLLDCSQGLQGESFGHFGHIQNW